MEEIWGHIVGKTWKYNLSERRRKGRNDASSGPRRTAAINSKGWADLPGLGREICGLLIILIPTPKSTSTRFVNIIQTPLPG